MLEDLRYVLRTFTGPIRAVMGCTQPYRRGRLFS